MTVEVRGMLPGEIDGVLDMVSSVMIAPREYFECIWRNSPGSKDEHSRLAVVDGEVASHQRLYDRSMRLGGTAVRQGGTGDVCTSPDHRRKGYGRLVLDDAFEYFRAGGYDLSVIMSGAHHFYCNCGYEKVPQRSYRAAVAPGVFGRKPDLHVRWFDRDRDLEAVSDIYDHYNACRPLTTVRGVDHLRRQLSWSRREVAGGCLVCEAGGRGGTVAAYLRGRPGEIIEIGCIEGGNDALSACIGAALEVAAGAGMSHISLACPADESLLEGLRSRLEVEEVVKESFLVRIVNLAQLLGKLADEMTGSLGAAGTVATASLGFEVAGQAATVSVDGGAVSVEEGIEPGAVRVAMSQRDFMLLVSGSDFPLDKALPEEIAGVAAAISPPAGPVYWGSDVV